MARKYSRDNRGRFASSGSGGATARGGRLKTAAGDKRQGQTMKAAGGQKGTIGKSKGLKKPETTSRKAAAKTDNKPLAATTANGKRLGGSNQKLEFQRLYHGTSKGAADSIRNSGFKKSEDGFLGKGVYFSSDKKVAGYYKSVAEGKTGSGAVLAVRVPKSKINPVQQDSFFVASKAAKSKAQKLVNRNKVVKLQAPDDIQKVVLANEKTANQGLIRSNGTVRRRRRRR